MPRRAFLASGITAFGAALLPVRGAQAVVAGELASTGAAHPELASFDRLMTAFVNDHAVPGAALAVTRAGRLVYARGFGFADRRENAAVRPTSLFRIASVSKPITAAAVLQLVERGAIALETRVWEYLALPEPADGRWKQVTVRQLLQHTGGWDRERSFDPMFRSSAIARDLGVPSPAQPVDVIRYMLARPLDFAPGERHAYSNFGYCLLGRVVERAAGVSYEQHVRREVLAPLGIRRMRIGATLPAQRAADEVTYHDTSGRTAPAVVGNLGARVPAPYGAWFLEAMDAHGGWIASAVDVARFATAFDQPPRFALLQPSSIATMFARPDGAAGNASAAVYYGCGWRVRVIGAASRINAWHAGALPGTSTLLVRRHDSVNWAVLFNARDAPDGTRLSAKIDPLLHGAANQVRTWPDTDEFTAQS